MKQPSWKAPLILSIVLVGVGGFAYWLQFKHKPQAEKIDSALKKPISLPNDDVQIAMFKVKSAKGLIEGKCDDLAKKNCKISSDGNWTITYPETFKADPSAVKEVINGIATAIATDTVDLSTETAEKRQKLLEDYGLSDAKRTDLNAQFIELVLENGTHLAAWFGQEHPLGDKTFVASSTNGTINTNTVFLLSDFYKNVFDHTLAFFKSKDIFDFDRTKIESFEAKLTDGKVSAQRKDGLWNINDAPGDYERIEAMLTSIAQVKAKDFPSVEVLKGLKPVVSYTLKSKDATYSFELYERIEQNEKKKKGYQENPMMPSGNHLYIKTSSRKELMEVERNFKNQVDKKITQLRKSSIFSEAEKVTANRIKIEGTTYPSPVEFSYVGNKWVQTDAGMKIDPILIAKLVDLMASSRAADFVTPRTGKADHLIISIGDEKNLPRFHMDFYVLNDVLYAKDLNSKRNETMILDESLKIALPFKEESWKLKK